VLGEESSLPLKKMYNSGQWKEGTSSAVHRKKKALLLGDQKKAEGAKAIGNAGPDYAEATKRISEGWFGGKERGTPSFTGQEEKIPPLFCEST